MTKYERRLLSNTRPGTPRRKCFAFLKESRFRISSHERQTRSALSCTGIVIGPSFLSVTTASIARY
jgi:hypothetical protein